MDWSHTLDEALCGRGCLLTKSELTEDEKDTVRGAEIKARWLKQIEVEKHGADVLTYFNGQSPHRSYELSQDKIRELQSKALASVGTNEVAG